LSKKGAIEGGETLEKNLEFLRELQHLEELLVNFAEFFLAELD